jgi:superfamily II DNA or RNA helicase
LDQPLPKPLFLRSPHYYLRDYQFKAAEAAVTHRFGIIKAPPRSGKTQIFISIVDSEQEYPVIFFVRSIDLAKQTVERVREYLPEVAVGKIGDGECDIQPITVITFQSAYAAYDKEYDLKQKGEEIEKGPTNKKEVRRLIENSKLVFVDECHHMTSTSAGFILNKCNKATMKIGLSATPFGDKDNALLVEERLGPVLFEIDYGTLIREGYILRPYIYMYKLPKLVDLVDGNYQSIYKQAVVNNEYLSLLVKKLVDKLNNMGKSVVIQTEYKNHTRQLADLLGCDYLYGEDRSHKRSDIIDKLRQKEILCLVSTLFEEGLDVPSLDYTINLAGGLEQIGVLQRMRSMTADDGKTSCGVIDFIHQVKYLSKHSKRRKELYMSEPEFVVQIRDVSKLAVEEI